MITSEVTSDHYVEEIDSLEIEATPYGTILSAQLTGLIEACRWTIMQMAQTLKPFQGHIENIHERINHVSTTDAIREKIESDATVTNGIEYSIPYDNILNIAHQLIIALATKSGI